MSAQKRYIKPLLKFRTWSTMLSYDTGKQPYPLKLSGKPLLLDINLNVCEHLEINTNKNDKHQEAAKSTFRSKVHVNR